jgi:hypothetical protein
MSLSIARVRLINSRVLVTIQLQLIALKVSCGSDAHVATEGFKSRRGRRSHLLLQPSKETR